MLTIRLQRTGTKNKPQFRLVLAQKYRAVGKNFLEILGHYNPRSKQFGLKDEERLKHWLSKNVELSPTVHNLLVEKQFLKEKKVHAWTPKKKPASKEEASSGESATAKSEGGKESAPQEMKAESKEAKPEEKKEEPKTV